MKYNKEWKRLMETEEYTDLRRAALSYDTWKQRLKQPSVHFQLNWPLYLDKDCLRTDAYIFRNPPRLGIFSALCNPSYRPLTPQEKLRMCDLNRRTLYKVCKRIDKHLLPSIHHHHLQSNNDNTRAAKGAAMAWYNTVVQQRRYRFLGCPELFGIRLRASNLPVPVECPICLEPMPSTTCVATACGHAFCTACDKQMRNRDMSHCPMCRAPL